MYKVADTSAPALCFSSSYNDFLFENVMFAVGLCEKGSAIPCLRSSDVWRIVRILGSASVFLFSL